MPEEKKKPVLLLEQLDDAKTLASLSRMGSSPAVIAVTSALFEEVRRVEEEQRQIFIQSQAAR